MDVDDYFETEIPLTPEQDRYYATLPGRGCLWIVGAIVALTLGTLAENAWWPTTALFIAFICVVGPLAYLYSKWNE